jgi:ribosomal protein S18 acetylase RimI-like enzyme
MSEQSGPGIMDRIDQYLDLAPRQDGTTEQLGPFTLFLGHPDGWNYYARPSLSVASEIDSSDVARVLARQAALGVGQAIEGLVDTAPSLATACRDAGLVVTEYPLMVHHDPVAVPVPDGIRIRRLEADDPAVAASRVVAGLGFAAPGTGRGEVGPTQRDAVLQTREPGADDHLRRRIGDGRSVVVVAEDETGVLAAGSHHPVGDATEIVGLATLPSARHRGLGAAIVDTLVADAFRREVMLVVLTASDDDVGRIYERVGFRRVGTGLAAEPPTP